MAGTEKAPPVQAVNGDVVSEGAARRVCTTVPDDVDGTPALTLDGDIILEGGILHAQVAVVQHDCSSAKYIGVGGVILATAVEEIANETAAADPEHLTLIGIDRTPLTVLFATFLAKLVASICRRPAEPTATAPPPPL